MARLEEEGLEDCLELVHCHVGSQLYDMRRVKEAIGELSHVYVPSWSGMGATETQVSGYRWRAWGVDYDGSQTSFLPPR